MKKLWKKITGWGAYPSVKAEVWQPATIEDVRQIVIGRNTLLARGSGYSYGDSSLHETIISTSKLNKIIAAGDDWIEVEAGITLEAVLHNLIAKHKFLLVTPGTTAVTIGGAIASDVHGKNHRRAGSFFNITESLKLVNEKGELTECSRLKNKETFYKCFGGMGLQGIIVSAAVKTIPLPSPLIEERQFVTNSLAEMFLFMHQYRDADYLVAWLDLIGKEVSAVVKTGTWNLPARNTATSGSRTFKIPFVFPLAPPRFLFKWYNKRYLITAKKNPLHIIPLNQFFYPLDSIKNWRYIFGKKGLLQYHFVLPLHVSESGITEVIGLVKNSKAVCTLAVLKLFGKGNEETPQVFSREGFNLALGFIRTEEAVGLIGMLDKKIHALGGQIYKSKDAISVLPKALQSGKFKSMQNQRYAGK